MSTESRTATAFDQHIGQRLRSARLLREISQERLGEALDLTFQQIQKYEKGVNTIRLERMLAICDLLEVDMDFFVSGAPGRPKKSGHVEPLPPYATAFFELPYARSIASGFVKIKSEAGRGAVRTLVRVLSEESSDG